MNKDRLTLAVPLLAHSFDGSCGQELGGKTCSCQTPFESGRQNRSVGMNMLINFLIDP
jgi:hypothetical protein